MALEVRSLRDGARPAAIIADRRLWLADDRTTVVEDGDPRAAFLLVGAGGEILAADVERLGLALDEGRVAVAPTKDTGETEKLRPAAENKARRKGEDK